MDIVVRTPHGDADVSISSHAPTTTLGEVVAAVTGQAVPRLVLVDGRAVDANTQLDGVHLLLGSVVNSQAPVPPGTSDADVELVQVAGHGAGRTIRLGPGRYRVGPGRRSNANELDEAPVDRSMFELVVESSGTTTKVSVVPDGSGVTIDGEHVEDTMLWRGGTLTVGSRVFQVDNPAPSDAGRPHREPDPDGTVPFSRPPRRMSTADRRPVIDAVRAAAHTSPTLWERRPEHADAFVLPIGIRAGGVTTVQTDLRSERGVAITGSERFRDALARSLVLEAVTLHGPADLDLVVLTDPDRLAHWDWAKWLPHVRVDGRPAIWGSRHDIARWGRGMEEAGVSTDSPSRSPHLTVVVLDDPGLWNRRDSPLRSIVANPPDDLRLIALCDDETQAPAACTSVISDAHDELARVHPFARVGADLLLRAALTEVQVAVRVARALAPLADVELPTPAAPTRAESDRVELSELIGATEPDEILTRWAAADASPVATIGRRGDEFVEVPVVDDVTVVVGSTMIDAFDVAATSLLAQCVERSPDALWIAPMVLQDSPRAELLWQLPHATDRHGFDSAIDPRRLLVRLRALLNDRRGPARIVLVAEAGGDSTTSPGDSWLTALADGVRTIAGLAMVVVTDRPEVANLVGDTVIRVERRYDVPGTVYRVAVIASPGDATDQPFTPLQPTASAVPLLELRPFVVGRSLTALERRIEQRRAQAANASDPAFDIVVATLRDVASRVHGDDSSTASDGRAVVPPPIPTRIALDELFDSSPGDGVPLGLVDDSGSARLDIRWWEPGSGSLLVFGSRRSGMDQVLATILLGVIDRISALDVDLVVVEPSAERRRMLAGIDRPMRVVAPDRTDMVTAALDEIVAELQRCSSTTAAARHGAPRMVVLIGDLVDLRRRYVDQPLGARIDEVLTRAAAANSGVDLVAAAADLEGAGPFAAEASSSLVGASSDLRELAALGVDQPGDLDGIVGRCRSFPGGALVQVATTDTPIETLLARRSIGGTP
jgi:DNA segregation ATPase FtsK/SpoIIIE, S-DNA-T family